MSRSWKNYPFVSTGNSDRFQKRRCNKGLRHKSNERLQTEGDPDFFLRSDLPDKNEIIDDYDFNRSDGYDVDMQEDNVSHFHFTKKGKLRK